jgi:hypothetical protein
LVHLCSPLMICVYPDEEVLYWSKDLLLPMSLVFSNSVCYPVQHLHNQSELQQPRPRPTEYCGCSNRDRSGTLAVSQFQPLSSSNIVKTALVSSD